MRAWGEGTVQAVRQHFYVKVPHNNCNWKYAVSNNLALRE